MGAGASSAPGAPPASERLASIAAEWRRRCVVLHSLTSAAGAALNGRLGEVRDIDEASGRLCVRLSPTDPVQCWKNIREANVHAATAIAVPDSDEQATCVVCFEGGDAESALVRLGRLVRLVFFVRFEWRALCVLQV